MSKHSLFESLLYFWARLRSSPGCARALDSLCLLVCLFVQCQPYIEYTHIEVLNSHGCYFHLPFQRAIWLRSLARYELSREHKNAERERAANWNNIHHIRIAWIDNFSCEFEMYNSWADWRCGRLGRLGTVITWRDFRSSEEFITVFCSTREDLLHAFIIINHNCI